MNVIDDDEKEGNAGIIYNNFLKLMKNAQSKTPLPEPTPMGETS